VLDDLLLAVGNDRDPLQRKAQPVQLLGQPVRVGVERKAAQQLVADRDDGRGHRQVIAGGGG
jgi:hypothetical protein